MNSFEQIEKKNRRIGLVSSILVQLFLLLIFYFLIAWKAPFPPIPEYGIELGFLEAGGSSAPQQSSSPPPEPIESEENEESLEAEPPSQTPEDPTSEPVETVEESELPLEEEALPESEEAETASETLEPETEEVAEESVAEEQSEDTPEVQEPTEEEDKTEDLDQTEEEVEEEPTIDQRSIYGSQGASADNTAGASLSLAGWIWDFKPEPDDTSEEVGKIEYNIAVDEEGYLLKIDLVLSTVSPSVERKYREAVQKLTFSKTSEYQPAPLSKGTLTFIITTK